MQPADIEPLDPLTWFAEIEKLQLRRAGVDGEAPDALLRMAFFLIQLAPRPTREFIPLNVDEASFENFLDCGAYATAAMALLPPPTALTLIRSEESDKTTAIVKLAGSGQSTQDEDKEPAKALLGAWCQSILSLRSRSKDLSSSPTDQRTSQYARGQHSTKH